VSARDERTAVLLRGGPLDGQGLFTSEWTERRAAAERMAPTRETPSPVLAYRQHGPATTVPRDLAPYVVTEWRWTP
jgi:hypothetical protein